MSIEDEDEDEEIETSESKALKMMRKMGWKEGKGKHIF